MSFFRAGEGSRIVTFGSGELELFGPMFQPDPLVGTFLMYFNVFTLERRAAPSRETSNPRDLTFRLTQAQQFFGETQASKDIQKTIYTT